MQRILKNLPYGREDVLIRLEYPLTWDAYNIETPTLMIRDTQGNDLVEDPIECEIFAYAQLESNAQANDYLLTLDVDGDQEVSVVSGDWIRIQNDSGYYENVEVKAFYADTNLIELQEPLVSAFPVGSYVVGLFCTATVDLSDVEVFPAGKQVILLWDSGVDGFPVEELCEISKFTFQPVNFEERFATLYPREYAVLKRDGRLEKILTETISQLSVDLQLRGLLIDRVVDQSLLLPVLMAKARWLILLNGDDSYRVEREVASQEYTRQFELLCSAPIWVDANSDGIKQPTEVGTHKMFFERGF